MMFKVLGNSFKTLVMAVLLIVGISSDMQAQDATGLKPVVAVFDVSVDGMSLPLKAIKLLTGYLSSRLTAGGVYKVGPGSAIKEAMIDLKIESQKECYDQACRIELGKSAAANMNLNSQIWKVGKLCSVNLDLYDLKTEAMENSVEVSGLDCSESGLKVGIAKAAAQISSGKMAAVQSETGGNYQNTFAAAPELGASSSSLAGTDNLPTIKAETGYLSVDGNPKGARVDISGPKGFGDNGKVATALPVRPAQVPAGNYTVKVSWTDYDTEEKTVRVYADTTETVKVDLVKSIGELELSGKPEGAKSHLECQKGFTRDFGLPANPLKLTVPRGDCRLTVERDGYEKYDSRTTVQGGKVSQVKVDLKLAVVRTNVDRQAGGNSEPIQYLEYGAWKDPSTGLTWQNPSFPNSVSWSEAKKLCASLNPASGNWRLPTIDELRSLMRGCPSTARNGACSTQNSTWLGTGQPNRRACQPDCGFDCHWPSDLRGNCSGTYWSSSPILDHSYHDAWVVAFVAGMVTAGSSNNQVRCVR